MIDLQHLSKHFGSLKAVDDLSIQVPRGEIFCFLGPNGAGKTTTIKMLCGLLKPSEGTIRIGDIDLRDDPLAVRRLTGYIPDQPYMYERLTALEYCRFVADLFKVPRDVADQRLAVYFDLFGLQEYGGSLIKDLSHGFRQRLIYAATFLHEPSVLFVDEPFIGLDPYSIRTIRDTLKRKAREGMTVFLTTHILALAEDLADRVGILVKGRLEACGTLGDLSRQHAQGGNLEDIFLKLTT
ncbi:MAG: ABC transporter ATP-binding protein [Lentisphaerota bacterium]